jgi:hypothetical protein
VTEQEGTRSPTELRQADLISGLILSPFPSAPAVQKLRGYLGESDKEGHWRLYPSENVASYVEFREEDVLRAEPVDIPGLPRGISAVWLKLDARLRHVRTETQETQGVISPWDLQGGFLGGPITAGFTPRGFSMQDPLARWTPPTPVVASTAVCTAVGVTIAFTVGAWTLATDCI